MATEETHSKKARELLEAWQAKPQIYFKDILGVDLIWRMQNDLLDACPRAIKEHKHVYVASGHCFAKGTSILMYDGSIKSVEDVSVNDKLMGDDSTPRNVVSLCSGKDLMYKVSYYDGTEYVHNESHILSLVAMSSSGSMVKNKIYNISIKEYLDLNAKWRRRLSGYRVGVDFPEKRKIIPDYIFGLWLGDGCECNADFCNTDKEILYEIEKYCTSIGCTFSANSNNKNVYLSCGKSGLKTNPFINNLKKLNVFRNKHIPYEYLTGSRKQRLELLAGIIDSDGSRHRDGGYEITQKRKHLSEQIQFLARSLGMKSSITERDVSVTFKSGHKTSGKYYRVYISSGVAVPSRLKRKQSGKLTGKRNVLHTGIKGVECLGIGNYYGFNIDGNKRFLGKDFLVLHNSLGKDWTCGGISLWFLHSFSPSIVIQTAPTDRQVQKIMWGETLAHWNKRKIDLGGTAYTSPYLEIQKDNWYLIGFTTREAGASRTAGGGKFQGFHSPNICVIVSEAQAVEDGIYDQIDGIATSENVLVIFIGNPTTAAGRFAKGLRDKENNIVFNFSCLENPNYLEKKTVIPGLASYEWVEDKRIKWGEGDPRWDGRVLGQIPMKSIDSVISRELIERNKNRRSLFYQNRRITSADFAGTGICETVYYNWDGGNPYEIFTLGQANGPQNAHHASIMCDKNESNLFIGDADGLGSQLMGFIEKTLTKKKIEVIHYHGSAKPISDKKQREFGNMRAQAFFHLKDELELGRINIPDDEILLEGLAEPKYFEKKGKLWIEDKEDIEDRLGRPFDREDAFVMGVWGLQFSKNTKKKDPYFSEANSAFEQPYHLNPATV